MDDETQVSNSVPSFVGSMQQFVFNGQNYFEIARSTGGTPAQKGRLFRLFVDLLFIFIFTKS